MGRNAFDTGWFVSQLGGGLIMIALKQNFISGTKRKPLAYLRKINYLEPEDSENHLGPETDSPSARKVDEGSDKTPLIAGAVLGGVILIGIGLIIAFIYFKRR